MTNLERHSTLIGLTIAFYVFILSGIDASAQYRRDRAKFQESYRVPRGKALQVIIGSDAAEVEIKTNSKSREARVTIYYVDDEFKVKVRDDFSRKHPVLRIAFDRKGWMKSGNHDLHAEAIIELPPAVEIDLEAKIKAGEVNMDFGGLSLANLDLTTWAGAVNLDFSEANKTEMDFLRINTKIGETDIFRIGNARFRDAEINGGIGEMKVDFSGAFHGQATAEVDLDIGETTIYLQEDVGVKLAISKFLFFSETMLPTRFSKDGKYYYSDNYDQANVALALKVSPGLGGFRIDY
ncbi:cell wall-active antibiotics response protein [bacterium]|nr:cell wall-active antibiotics response protein [bacterium]